ncbi:hypothetical protein [Marinibactrum halimedae]|uniref:Lipoprotein n=1 Tax=Marinibactrum halimedae TaxID=1444977 RepID=A0AA37TAB2_9GAMM|nr:hypothetical protein [Marinibactrum halimedae]MCD9458868.1 hypothetical protein [Marinibactrum halimedae]GLS27718.1 hypothetical protein GCM10007877_34370 [Marinibactrum halimedae]
MLGKFKTLVLSAALCLAGCASVQESTRVATNLKAREYNSLAANYMLRPTFTSVENMSDGSTVLSVSRDGYGGNDHMVAPIRFLQSNTDGYVSLIDKYFEWDELALSRGDAITKEIGRVDSWSAGPSGEIKFVFHSGNSERHFLSVSFCAVGTCLDDNALFFDPVNAKELKRLLLQLSSNEIKVENVDDIYK